MHRDESGFILRERYAGFLPNGFDRHAARLIFLGIELPDVPQKRVVKRDPLFLPLERGGDMVGQRDIDAVRQRRTQHVLGAVDDALGQQEVRQRDAGQQLLESVGQLTGVQIKPLFDLIGGCLVPCAPSKGQPAPHQHGFCAGLVPRDHYIIIQHFFNAHGRPPRCRPAGKARRAPRAPAAPRPRRTAKA